MSQQATMTMPGMGGPIVAMNMGTPNNGNNAAIATANTDPSEYVKRLNTYIYDYFMRNQHYECAKVMLSESLPLGLHNKTSPNQRQANGLDDMDDNKDMIDRPKDLPLPDLPATGGPFLEDWWFQFWDVWNSRRSGAGKQSTLAYITHQRNAQKARSGMMGTIDPAMQRNFSMMNGGVMPADLKKAAMHNSGNMNPANLQAQINRARAQQGQQLMQGNTMERQGSQMDARSGSPGSGGQPSPKRPRVDGGTLNNMQMAGQQNQQTQQGNQQQNQQQVPGQAQPPRPGQLGQVQNDQVGAIPNHPPLDPEAAARLRDLLIRHNVDPNAMPSHIFHDLAMQPTNYQIKSLAQYNTSMQAQMKNALNQAQASSNLNKGMPPNSAAAAAAAIQAGAQASPMPQNAMDGMMFDNNAAANGMMRNPSMLPNQQAAAVAAAMGNQNQQAGANGTGSHALQDYQMQLMLLEQQNKRRLMMARQEQDGMSAHTGVPVGNGQFAPNMSPGQGGPSPNPNEMRGTPKMNNGPSPNGGLAGRGSPAPGAAQFDPNMPPALRNQMMMGPNGHMIPRSNAQMTPAQMEMFRAQQGQMMANGAFPVAPGMPPNIMPGQQSGPGAQPGQVAPNMTPRQGPGQMPPPPAPQQNAGNTQPSSPAPSVAPPTPSQTAKAKPGAKKETKASKAANKKNANATAATPSEADQPPTPGSQAPVTPLHNKNANAANGAQPNGQGVMQQPGQDLPVGFGMDGGDQFNMLGDFAMDGNTGDVLENFDFDAFLNNTGDDGGIAGFGDHFSFDNVGGVEGGEALQ